MKLKDKYRQIKNEAGACVIALLVLMYSGRSRDLASAIWDITVYHTPLWAITGCLGPWVFSIIMVVWMVKKVFKDLI